MNNIYRSTGDGGGDDDGAAYNLVLISAKDVGDGRGLTAMFGTEQKYAYHMGGKTYESERWSNWKFVRRTSSSSYSVSLNQIEGGSKWWSPQRDMMRPSHMCCLYFGYHKFGFVHEFVCVCVLVSDRQITISFDLILSSLRLAPPFFWLYWKLAAFAIAQVWIDFFFLGPTSHLPERSYHD